MSNAGEFPRPPEPPPLERRLRFSWPQGLMIAVVVATVAFALAGGTERGLKQVVETSSTLEVQVEYPARLRHSKRGAFRVRVEYVGTRAGAPAGTDESAPGRPRVAQPPADSVTLILDPALMRGYDEIIAVPSFDRAYVATLPLGPAGVAVATIEVRAERAGWNRGTLRVAAGADTLTVPLQSLTLP